jgi:CRP-like cAMP-binding protein
MAMKSKALMENYAPQPPPTGLPSASLLGGVRSRFLEGLAPADLNVIIAAAKSQRLSAHSVVTHDGDAAGTFFLLTKGRARFFYITEEGRKLLLHWLAPGEVFGVMSLLPTPSSYLVSTEMVKDSWVLLWDRATICSLIERYPRLALNALSSAADYLILYRDTHTALTCHNARKRLAQVLLSLSRGIGQEVPGGIELDVTNEELANAANITLFTTSRLLNEWKQNGTLLKSRGKILLRSREKLRRSQLDKHTFPLTLLSSGA